MPRVTFKLDEKNAKEVYLAGTFNNWREREIPMRRTKKGHWSVTITLPYGRYEYLYIVDGKYREDPQADKVPNQYGTYNSVREVVKKPRKKKITTKK